MSVYNPMRIKMVNVVRYFKEHWVLWAIIAMAITVGTLCWIFTPFDF